MSKSFLILEISLSSCLHSNFFCCNVNLILSGDVKTGAFNLAGVNLILSGDLNLTGAFNLAGAVQTAFLKLTSLLNFMFSA